MVEITNSEQLRRSLSDHLTLAQMGERVIIRRHGQDIATLVSMVDYETLEQIDRDRDSFLKHRQEEHLTRFYRMQQRRR